MKAFEYIKQTKAELKHVSWPTKKQVTLLTIFVVLVSVAIAYFLGLFDYIFSFILERLVL